MTIEYSKHSIPIADRDLSRILRDIAGVGGASIVIAVNISSPSNTDPVFFSDESLRALLAEGPDRLFVEALPFAVYVAVVGQQIDHVVREGENLRLLLCTRDVGELSAEMAAFLALVDRVALLVGGFALQRRQYEAVPEAAPLERVRRQLEASALELGDNSRTMDDIHYELVPALGAIKRSLEKVAERR